MLKLSRVLLLLALLSGTSGAVHAKNPGWRLIFNNDMTNILVTNSPYNPSDGKQVDTSEDFSTLGVLTEEMLRESVRETAVPGVDAISLTPGLCWVPWWPSKIYSMAEHAAWFEKRYGIKATTPFNDYLLNGGDIIGPFVDECHKRGVAAVISYRLNDAHWVEYFEKVDDPKYSHTVTRFYAENPDLRIGTQADADPKTGLLPHNKRVHDWSRPEARQYKFSLMQEMCELYDIDGLELDLMRFASLFKDDFPMDQRSRIMTEFVAQVRAMLDRTQRGEKRRWLGVRIPIMQEKLAGLGVDIPAFSKAGVDYFNVSVHYETSQQGDLAQIKRMAGDTPVYGELTHASQTWALRTRYDGQGFRRSTREMLSTTAHLFYARGADGLSLFNYVYYREFGNQKILRGPFNEPDFDLLTKLADRDWVTRQPQLYFLRTRDQLFEKAGDKKQYQLDMAPGAGADKPGTLRIQVLRPNERSLGEGQTSEGVSPKPADWKVTVNGRELKATDTPQPVYPYPTPIKAGFGLASQYLAFELPPGTLREGNNVVEVQGLDKNPWHLRWIEAALAPFES